MKTVTGLAAALCAASAFGQYAQFSQLATTQDGSQVLFTTSFPQRGTDQSLGVKLFRYGPRGPDIVIERPCRAVLEHGDTECSISSPQISGDGSVIAHTGVRHCVGGSSCFLNEQHFSTVVAGGETRTYGGQLLLSRNGCWLVTFSSPNVMGYRASRIDRRTGEVTSLPSGFRPAAVADDGSLLATDGTLLRTSGVTGKTVAAGAAVMDDGAATAAGESARRVFVVDIPTGRRWFVGPGTRDEWQPRLNADGRWLLYLTRLGHTPQVMFSRADGSDWRQLTALDEGVQEAALSGDGRVVWAVTGRNALVKIDTLSGAADEVIAPTPALTKITPLVPGSLVFIEGSGLPAEPRITLDGRSLPVYASSPGAIAAQVPWDFPAALGAHAVVLAVEPGSPQFESAVRATPLPLAANLVAPPVHEDFRGPVTESDRARPGEILHLWLTGLGPVDPPIANAQPAPLDRLSRVTEPWEFTWDWGATSGNPAEVLSATLAPGLVGLYQVDLRVPVQATGGSLYLRTAVRPWYNSWGLAFVPFLESMQ